MARKTKDWLRKPLTEEEQLEGKRYYSEADFDAIVATFEQVPEFSREKFERRLESVAWYFVSCAAISAKISNDEDAKTPTAEKRYWKSLGNRLEAILDRLQHPPTFFAENLEYAMEQHAKATNSLPDFEIEKIEPDMGVWPVGRQRNKCIANIEWLRACVEVAEISAEAEQGDAGGNRPDEELHCFYQTAAGLFNEYSAEHGTAYFDRYTNKAVGKILDYLEVCLIPLGYPKDDRGPIKSTYDRIKKLDKFDIIKVES